jgi:hypothetical protein
MSEHTAEYVLVGDLVRRLSPAFPNVISMFFWATREGNRTAIKSMAELNLRLVMCFARRPKIEHAEGDHILMKINPELVHYSNASAALNIPVLVGLPMVTSLSSLRLNSPCHWFDLVKFECANQPEFYVAVAPNGEPTLCDSNERLTGPLTDLEIEEVVRNAPLLTWSRAIEHLRDVRRTVYAYAMENYGRTLPISWWIQAFSLAGTRGRFHLKRDHETQVGSTSTETRAIRYWLTAPVVASIGSKRAKLIPSLTELR